MVYIYCKATTERIKYTVDLIFSEILGISYKITNDIERFNKSSETKINYSKEKLGDSFRIEPVGLLKEVELVKQDIRFAEWNNLPVFFHRNEGNVPFDIFSAVFYLISRYEEYLPFQADAFERFEASQSIAFRGNFLNIPIVDLWCIELAKLLGIYKECKNISPANYTFQLTVDIDQAWIYKNKGIINAIGSSIRDLLSLKFKKIIHRSQVYFHKLPDPGDTFDYLKEIQKKLNSRIRYFILCGKKTRYDNNISIRNKNFQNLIRNLDQENTVGLHPSYASNKSTDKLEKECNYLSKLINKPVEISRQHYLKLSIPETYQNLIKIGITEDFTMGYGSQTGFRAGIARPFYFYDLYEEKQTSLKIVPFQVMDRTLLSYLCYSAEQANLEFEYYTKTIKSVGGQFVCLWHNTSLSNFEEWEGWKTVFEHMVKLNSGND